MILEVLADKTAHTKIFLTDSQNQFDSSVPFPTPPVKSGVELHPWQLLLITLWHMAIDPLLSSEVA